MTQSSAPAPSQGPPSTLRNAVLLLWVLIGIGLVRVVLTFAMADSLMEHWIEQYDPEGRFPREMVESAAPAYGGLALVSGALFAAVLALCAIFLARGARWAHVVAIVFGILTALGGAMSLIQPVPVLFTVVFLVTAVVAIAALVFLFAAPTRAYVRR